MAQETDSSMGQCLIYNPNVEVDINRELLQLKRVYLIILTPLTLSMLARLIFFHTNFP